MSSKAILLSIRPKYVALIQSGEKTYELRRKRPKIENGDLALIYESSPTKSMVGAFIVGEVLSFSPSTLWLKIGKKTGISRTDFDQYFEGCIEACAIEIVKYWSLSSPMALSQLRTNVKIEPPQSYRYLCEEQTGQILAKRH